jgi:chemotaxis protein methyltransferase CheR
MTAALESRWVRLSELVAQTMGLHFPPERLPDLQRGVDAATREIGLENSDWALSGSPGQRELDVLATHLTIGETYFFRDDQAMRALAGTVLPELIRRRGAARRLRFWSAGCCTGEEPYSLAILLHQVLPDLTGWNVTIRATDINRRFLDKAEVGVYGKWSFRNTPEEIKARYFTPVDKGRFAISPELRRMVTFAQLNLMQDAYASCAIEEGSIDLVLCRNVLMYFTPVQMRRVIAKLGGALVEGGWLAVSPSEVSQSLFGTFTTVNCPGAVLYRKTHASPGADSATPKASRPVPQLSGSHAAPRSTHPGPLMPDIAPFTKGSAGRCLDFEVASRQIGAPAPSAATATPLDASSYATMARSLANDGQLAAALGWCDRWVTADKLEPQAHYLRASIFLEQGDAEQARACLQRATYLQPDFVMAHFALCNLARQLGRAAEAGKHWLNTRQSLKRHEAGDVLPGSDGLTAGSLAQALALITERERPNG